MTQLGNKLSEMAAAHSGVAAFSAFEKYQHAKTCLLNSDATLSVPVSVIQDDDYCHLAYLHSYKNPEYNDDFSPAQAVERVNEQVDALSPNHAVRLRNQQFAIAKLKHLPGKIRVKIAQEYMRRMTRKDGTQNLRGANIYLRQTTEFINQVWIKYPFHKIGSFQSRTSNKPVDRELLEKSPVYLGGFELIKYRKSKRLKDVANRLALMVLDEVKDVAARCSGDVAFLTAYDAAAAVCEQWQIHPPYYSAVKENQIIEAAECAILRMTSPKWWLNQLSSLRDRCCEHLNIAAGLVGTDSPYISRDSFSEWCEQQKSMMNWLENTMIESESGLLLPLIDAAMSGNANHSNRFTEMIVRARGLEEIAEDLGYEGHMVTITAPSKYHRNSKKWNMEDPRFAQNYLSGQWRKIRSALSYRKINIKGLRVCEPHKDATPHWHILVFVKPENFDTLEKILTKYAFQVDGDEDGAEEYRLKVEPVDTTRGSAVGYVIKYISKGVRGEHMQGELDLESGLPADEAALNIAAWASRHKLRQFQFFGTRSVQVWREVRRIKEGPQPFGLEAARSAAQNSNWKEFEAALSVTPIKLNYEENECANEYGESTKRLLGLTIGIDNEFSPIKELITRGEKWTVRGMNDDEKVDYQKLKLERLKIFKENAAIKDKADKKPIPKWKSTQGSCSKSRGSGDTWTCRNKCTDSNSPSGGVQITAETKRYLASHGVEDPMSLKMLQQGLRIFTDAGRVWWIEDGQLQFEKLFHAEEHEFEYF